MNTYNPDTKEIVISNDRGDAYRYLSGYYTGLFMNDSNFDQL
jgi:nitric oxide reductase subunit B